ncbi:DUF2637 domain-containing protein [Allonocardiopsis opalescens]|uniref:Uncharacterized protein DUF2637 n=1 Tax=Allonocardiopsis opalescens TaxID=1144618 RepID=A0A2T0PQ10_9ACTN|nr:DUF2637 domain-containing protein [Allonocardiopsis opalescens]PRX90806.1 uncharacterized protein DUF2637 [Allonocardiopsis opalescens]
MSDFVFSLPPAILAVLTVAAVAVPALVVWLVWRSVSEMAKRFAKGGTTALLAFFVAVTMALSASGLIGFGYGEMGLDGWLTPLSVAVFLALDGAALAIARSVWLLNRDGKSAGVHRAFMWVLVAASAWFNWVHAPEVFAAQAAYALFPVSAAVLFELILAARRKADEVIDRRIGVERWLHPVEMVRVRWLLAADAQLAADVATRRVRVQAAANSLYRVRQMAGAPAPFGLGWVMPGIYRRAVRAAQAAAARADFADPLAAAEVVRQLQVLTLVERFAGADYRTPHEARDLVANLITPANLGVGGGADEVGLYAEFRAILAGVGLDAAPAERPHLAVVAEQPPTPANHGGGAVEPGPTAPAWSLEEAAAAVDWGAVPAEEVGGLVADLAADFVTDRQDSGAPAWGAGKTFARALLAAGCPLSDRQLRDYVKRAQRDLESTGS